MEVSVRRYANASNAFDPPARISDGEGLNDNPLIAVDGSGGAIVAWEEGVQEPETGSIKAHLMARRFSVDRGWPDGWELPELVSPYRPSVHQMLRGLAMTAAGHAIVSWGTLDEVFPTSGIAEAYLRVFEPGYGWPAPVKVSGPSVTADWVNVDVVQIGQRLQVVAAWTAYDNVTAKTNASGAAYTHDLETHSGVLGPIETLAADPLISALTPRVWLDAVGNAFVKVDMIQYTDAYLRSGFLSRYEAGVWTAAPLFQDGERILADAFSAGRGGDAVLLFERCDPLCQISGRRFSAGASDPVEAISSLNLGEEEHYPAVAVDGSGHAIAAWSEYHGGTSSLMASELDPVSGWSVAHSLADAQGGYFSVAVAFGPKGIGVVTWFRRDDAGESIWAAVYR
jgi:hypothetical protein